MPNIVRKGDSNNGGGKITDTFQDKIFFDGKPLALENSIGTSHAPCPKIRIHCAGNWKTSTPRALVSFMGRQIIIKGDSDTCGHTRSDGSPNIFFF